MTDTAPDYAEPLEGWRAWKLVRRDGQYVLGSVIYSTVWPVGEALVARCLSRRLRIPFRRREVEEAPGLTCQCGIYAGTRELAQRYLAGPPHSEVRVLGKVALWGSVLECERGYRASHAYPARIFVPAQTSRRAPIDWDQLVRALSRYGVPIEPLEASLPDAMQMTG